MSNKPSYESRVGAHSQTQLDPLGDSDALKDAGQKKNRAKVGSARPSSLLYTYGPGSIMDLSHFTVMPSGLQDWERIWARREGTPTIHAPALLDAVRTLLKHRVQELRPFPHQASSSYMSDEGNDLGIPARVFPQWLRCTGCDMLGPIAKFQYKNTNPYRSDEAIFEHESCPGRSRPGGKKAKGRANPTGARKSKRRPAVAARYLLTCIDGHLDEFPYDWWVHEGARCPKADAPILKMVDHSGGRGASATIMCDSCEARRPMNQAQGEVGRSKLPSCRGRHPHLDGFTPGGCAREPRLILVGASNLWFPALTSAIVMPRLEPELKFADEVDLIRSAFAQDPEVAAEDYVGATKPLRKFLKGVLDVTEKTNDELAQLLDAVVNKPAEKSVEEKREAFERWSPVDLLVPEWRYLQKDPIKDHHADDRSGLVLSPRTLSPELPDGIGRVLAVDKLRKVNALIGFTRVDEMDRVNDLASRLVPLTDNPTPPWVVATEDRGEGLFLQFDEGMVAEWEGRVIDSPLWQAHRASHRRNFENRFSDTAAAVSPDERLPAPRYWMIHTFAHLLFRQMALSSGYGAASISERLYAWQADGERPPAAGMLISTTASDSDGTLGGLVRLSDPDLLADLIRKALVNASRCSSDPICARRTPRAPEDFLHGAACHCCVMASETSCERANRFLDRRLLIPLPGSDPDLAFFKDPHAL